MVDSVTNNAISTLLRAQSTGTSAGIAALKNNNQAAQAIITQLQDGLNQSKNLTKQVAATSLSTNAASGSSLPRGSLLDMLV